MFISVRDYLNVKVKVAKKIENHIVNSTYYKQTMNSYCLSRKKDTKYIDPKVVKTKNNRLMMLSKCSVCNKQLQNIAIIKQFRNSNTFKSNSFVKCIILIYKMNNTINKFL